MSPAPQEYLRKMMQPGAVSHHVRSTLRGTMKRHGGDWKRLSWAAVLLDYSEAERLASDIAGEPRIVEDRGRIAGLGDAFFMLQDQLRSRAGALKEAAAAQDPKGVAAAVGQLADTCATCHAIYREPPTKP
jgi:hypothetical protein